MDSKLVEEQTKYLQKIGVLKKKPHQFKGDEFKEGDVAMDDCGSSLVEVTVKSWTPEYGGWWYVLLPNGGLKYTRRLITKDGRKLWNT